MTDSGVDGRSDQFEVSDPNDLPTVYTDWILTGGVLEGVVNLTLGTIEHTPLGGGATAPKVVVASRLRMSAAHAARLGEYLIALSRKSEDSDQSVGGGH